MSFLQPGTVFAKDFRIVRHLSSGGMGSVFVVEQLSTGKERALKVMHMELSADAAHRVRFESEARISASIESDHVVEVLAAGVDPETNIPWLVMELLRGDTLEGHVEAHGPMSRGSLRECARQLKHVLEQAHTLGLVHRDLKPENLFLAAARRQDVPFTLKILDFGIAKWAQEAKGTLKNSQMLGSPLWMAPEQLRPGATISPATDVWALGLIAYFLLTGSHYWATANSSDASITGLLMEIVNDPMPPPSERAKAYAPSASLPEGFDAWFAATTNRAPEGRFDQAGPCLDGLIAMLGEPSVSAAPLPSIGPRPSSASLDREGLSDSNDPEMLLRLARVYELRDTDQPRAVEAYRKVLELTASDDARDALVTLLERMGRYADLADVLTQEAERAGQGARAARLWRKVASAKLEHLGDEPGHLEALRQAFSAEPKDGEVAEGLVDALVAARGLDEAEAVVAAAREAGLGSTLVERLAGQVAEARGDLAGAEAAYARALEGNARQDISLLVKSARAAALSGCAPRDVLRDRWARVLAVDIEHTEAWEGILAIVADDAFEAMAVGDAARTLLGDRAPAAALEAASLAATKVPSMEIERELLEQLAEAPLVLPDGLASQLAEVTAAAPLASFGLGLKELVDPMTSSRALLTRAMPIYKQLSSAGAALDLPSTRKVYFREGGSAGLTRLHSDPPAVVIGAEIESFTPEEVVFAAFEFSARMRPELDAHFLLGQLPGQVELGPGASEYLEGVERAAAKVGLLASGRLSASKRPLASRSTVHPDAHLTPPALLRELGLFVASGAFARARKAAVDAA